MIDFRIGCSGYHYSEWKGLFYPADLHKDKWFEFYCEHFNTIELNVTFYKFPRVEFLKKWYDKAPEDFIFTVKAPRLITHFKKLKDSQRYLTDFYTAVSNGLKEKAGCVLFQFPSQFEYSEEHLDRIVEMLNPTIKNVVEFRHPSWWSAVVYNTLKDSNIVFCGMSHPELPDPVIPGGEILYYRFHGVPHLYRSLYENNDLEVVANQIVAQSETRQAYILFNNTAEGAALRNAKEFQEIIELVH
jgi:uncharacterized protein YecE (DUF72 family)